MTKETIAIASDHGGFQLKAFLSKVLKDKSLEILDLGTHDATTSVDYPDFGRAMAEAIKSGKVKRGVLICGSGIGISIAANRHVEVRAALIHDAYGARMCRLHNDANVIVFGGRVIGEEIAKECLEIFLSTEFEGGRHAKRVAKLG
ncbi:MAG: ribose 5-phosphate isomerase B [Alphaproteobacteria bacterium RIFOXYD12_FULL_60_8]|nr:MAG: ribose 5-phosphate isomerase B [Alphaproteobacteria bacterium RIFOXYD12_FULL_60_8]